MARVNPVVFWSIFEIQIRNSWGHPEHIMPGIKTINDPAAYGFYGGKDKDGKPGWTDDFRIIKPLLEWDINMGCVTVAYHPLQMPPL